MGGERQHENGACGAEGDGGMLAAGDGLGGSHVIVDVVLK
jgi:hypothetical protein